MNTLCIKHNNRVKKFQWRHNYNPIDFQKLLANVFKVKEKILGLKDSYYGNVYEISYFCDHPEEILNKPYSLVIETRSQNNSSVKKRQLQPENENFFREENNFKVFFLTSIEKLVSEHILTEKEYLYLKCLFFEENKIVNDFLIDTIGDINYFKSKLERFLILKNQRPPYQSSPTKINIDFRQILNKIIREKQIDNREEEFILKLLDEKDEILLSAIDLFEQENDEEELYDTINHLIRKKTGKTPVKINRETEKKSAAPKMEEIDEKNNENRYFTNKMSQSNENKIIQSNEKKPLEEPKEIKESPTKKPKGLTKIFKAFLEETEDQFQPEEIGMCKFLYHKNNSDLIQILNTCESIELAVTLIKKISTDEWKKFLSDNFSEDEIYKLSILKEKGDASILSTYSEFSTSSKVKNLLSKLKEIINDETKDLNENGRARGKTSGYSAVAMQKNLKKKESFNLTLRRGNSFQDRKSEGSIKDINDIKMLNNVDNEEVKDMLNKYHEKEDAEGPSIKNKIILQEILDKADFIKESDFQKYYDSLDSNSPILLDICNKYSKNKSIAKIKKTLLSILDKERDSIDFQASPQMKNKVKKLNSFKYIIQDLFNSKMITKKHLKLFYYLYMEEDIAILSAYEVLLINDDLQDFLETLGIIGKFHFFKTKLDFDEIEQFDEVVERQLCLLFAYKKYLNMNQRNNLEKIIRAGDISLLKLFQEFKNHKNKEDFINQLSNLAEAKILEVQSLEKIIKENTKIESPIEKRKETIDTFRQGKFLKDCKYLELIDKLIEDNHVLIQSVFEIFNMTKDKGEFVDNIKLIYNRCYKQNFKSIVNRIADEMKMSQMEIHFLLDCIEEDIPNILATYEIYMTEQTKEAEEELKESINIILRVYKKEIIMFEQRFYMFN